MVWGIFRNYGFWKVWAEDSLVLGRLPLNHLSSREPFRIAWSQDSAKGLLSYFEGQETL